MNGGQPPCLPESDRRPGETLAPMPERADAELYFMGTIRTPWTTRPACPKQGDFDGPDCHIQVAAPWADALDDIDACHHLQILYWMHQSRRDLTRQRPRSADRLIGTFALRSPMRPNPIASSIVRLVRRDGTRLVVRGLDCVDGTPLIDIKPERCPVTDPAAGRDRPET